MSDLQTIKIPDIGDFDGVEVIEVLVREGDEIQVETSLVTVESDKASMEIPSPVAGRVTSVLVKTGDTVAMGSNLLVVHVADSSQTATSQAPAKHSADTYDVVVIGAGPGGYTAAFRAADLGQKVLMIERYAELGGVCLNVGCIPSKALLHTAAIINETRTMAAHGVSFGEPEIDQRKVDTVQGTATFASANSIRVTGPDGVETQHDFRHAIIAAGSQSIKLPGFPYEDERLMDSTGALALRDIPQRLLVIGGGIIGLEMGSVYAGLGSQVTVVELSPNLMPGCDTDLVRPLQKRLAKQFENIFLNAKVTAIESRDEGLLVSFEGGSAPTNDTFDRVLLAIGRSPNGHNIEAANAGVQVSDRGFIEVDSQQRTNVPHIFAIGDIVGQPMLAHKATHEGKVAAEVIAGMKSHFDALTIPSVAYTDPEIAWMGLTETDAKANGVAYEKGVFPWAASGRALSMARSEGMTKVLYDPETHRILGCGIVGVNAGELIAEAVLALEMGADIADLALTVHPHPTLSGRTSLPAKACRTSVSRSCNFTAEKHLITLVFDHIVAAIYIHRDIDCTRI